MIRHFCDVDGREIESNEPIYSISIGLMRQAKNNVNWTGARRRSIVHPDSVDSAPWVDTNIAVNDVCGVCIDVVIERLIRAGMDIQMHY